MPNKEQLQILIKAKVITEGQAKGLQQLAKQLKTLQDQENAINKRKEENAARIKSLQERQMQLVRDVQSKNTITKKDLDALAAKYNALDKEIGKIAQTNQFLDGQTRSNTIAQRELGEQIALTAQQYKVLAAEAGKYNQYAMAGTQQAKALKGQKEVVSFVRQRNEQTLRGLALIRAQEEALVKDRNAWVARHNEQQVKMAQDVGTLNARQTADLKAQEAQRTAIAKAETEKRKAGFNAYIKAKNDAAVKSAQLIGQLDAREAANRIAVEKAVRATALQTGAAAVRQKIFERLEAGVEKVKMSLRSLGKTSGSTFQSMSRTVRRILTTMITLGTIVLFRNLIKQGAEFENTMIRVAAIANATTAEFKRLVGVVREVARDTIFTASEVGEVSKILGQAGFNTKEILASLKPILELTGATMGEIGETTELVISILRSFNLAAEDTVDVANVLTEATISSRASIERLSVAFRFGGPAAAAFNQSVETTTATLSRLIDLGLSASIAGTTLRRALIELSQGSARQYKVLEQINVRLEEVNPSFSDLGEILEKLARSTLSADQAIQLFGARAGASMFTLIQRIREGGETLTEFSEQLARSKEIGTVANVFEKISQSIRSQSLLTKSAFQEMGITIFQVFRPALEKILGRLRDTFLELNKALEANTGKNFAQTMLNLVPIFEAVLGAVIKIVGVIAFLLTQFSNLISTVRKFGDVLQWLIVIYAGVLALHTSLGKTLVFLIAKFASLAFAIGGQMILALGKLSTTMAVLLVKVASTTAAFNALRFAIGGVVAATGIGLAIFALTQILGNFISKMFVAAEATDEANNAIIDLAPAVKFGEEALKSLNKQIGIQIESMDELMDRAHKGELAYRHVGDRFEAIKFTPIEMEDLFRTEKAEQKVGQTIDTVVKEYKGMAKQLLNLAFDTEKALGNVNYEAYLGGFFDRAEKNIGAYINDFRDTFVNKTREAGIAIANDNIGGEAGEAFVMNMIEGAKKNFKEIGQNFKRAIDKDSHQFVWELQVNTEQSRAALSEFSALVGLHYSTLAPLQKKAVEDIFGDFIEASAWVDSELMTLNKNRAVTIDKEVGDTITRLGKIRQASEEMMTSIRALLQKGGIKAQQQLLDKQEEINGALEEEKQVVGVVGRMLGRLNILKEKAVGLDRTRLQDQIDALTQIQREAVEAQKFLASLKRRNAELAISNKQQEIYKINESITVAKAKTANKLFELRTKLIEDSVKDFSELASSSNDLMRSTESINSVLGEISQRNTYGEVAVDIAEISGELGIATGYQLKLISAEEELARLMAQRKDALISSGELMKENSTQEQLSSEIGRDINEVNKERGKILDAIENRVKNTNSVMDLLSKLNTKIMVVDKDRLSIVDSMQKKQRELDLGSDAEKLINSFELQKQIEKSLENQVSFYGKIKTLIDEQISASGESVGSQIQSLKEQAAAAKKAIADIDQESAILQRNSLARQAQEWQYLKDKIKTRKEVNAAIELEQSNLKAQLSLAKERKDTERNRIESINGAIASLKAFQRIRSSIDEKEKDAEKNRLTAIRQNAQIIDQKREQLKYSQMLAQASLIESFGGEKQGEKIRKIVASEKELDALRKKERRFQKTATAAQQELIRVQMQMKGATGEELEALEDKKTSLKSYILALMRGKGETAEELRYRELINKELKTGKTDAELFGKIIETSIKDAFEFGTVSEATKNMAANLKGIFAEFFSNKIKGAVEKAFGLLDDEAQKQADKLKKIDEDLKKDLLKNELDYLNKVMEAHIEHRKRMADINSDYDREIREVERDIFNERVQRMMDLAALEQELRYQGLTSEQQRADLLSTIDQNLASIRIGTIEQRQMKLGELEEQIKALNELENRLGISQSEIDQGSLARLTQLKTETAAFFNDKQRLAVSSLEAERKAELDAERARFNEQLLRLQREKDLADQLANQRAIDARAAVEEESKKSDALKRLNADVTMAIISGLAQVAAAKIASATKGIWASGAEAVASMFKWIAEKTGPLAFLAIPALIAGVGALVASLTGMFHKGGLVTEQSKAEGGIIRGGHGGIDDIHTTLPQGSYIVNRQSTRAHQKELAMMTSSIRDAVGPRNRLPVAVTAGEFYVPPGVYRKHADRINQINRDRSGVTAMEAAYHGGRIGLQMGGAVEGNNEPSRSVTVNNLFEFSGTNVFGGDEEAVRELYENSLRNLIQQDIDNNALL